MTRSHQIIGWLNDACQAYGDVIAVSDGDEDLTFAAFKQTADDLSARLSAAGLRQDEPVLVAISNRGRDVAAFLGIWQAGGVVVPIHRRTPVRNVSDAAQKTGARFSVNLRGDLPTTHGEVPETGIIVLTDEISEDRPILRGAAFIVFTSGTTGFPKGVVQGHRAYARKLDMIRDTIGFGSGGRTLSPLQLCFSFGHWVALLTLIQGGTLVLRSRFEPDDFLRDIRAGVTRTAMVPTMLRALQNSVRAEQGAAANGRGGFDGLVMLGGEVLQPALGRWLRRAWPEARPWDIFGLSETCTCDFFLSPEEFDAGLGTIGRPGAGIRYRFAPEDGELLIRTPYAMRGYLDAPGVTEMAYDDGYFRTGDLARETETGWVKLIGRSKDIVVKGGNKIAPLEVEAVVLEHPHVAAALAAGVHDQEGGEALHLAVVAKQGTQIDPAGLSAWAAERLERYKLPDHIHLCADLPTGRTGKADRQALRDRVLEKTI